MLLEEAFPNLKKEIKILKECDVVGHNGFECISIPDLKIRLILVTEDVQKAINDICISNIDAWFLDGFDPKKNPEMWTEDVLKAVFDLSSSDSSFSSFTSVGRIRRALLENGFEVNKVPGFGTKRHRIVGRKFEENKKSNEIKKIAILGAGLSGSNLAKLLPERPAPKIAIFLISLDFLFSSNFLPTIRCLLVPNPGTLFTSKPFSKSALLILPTEVKELKDESLELRSKTAFKTSSVHISGFFFGSNPSKNQASIFEIQISFIAF